LVGISSTSADDSSFPAHGSISIGVVDACRNLLTVCCRIFLASSDRSYQVLENTGEAEKWHLVDRFR
jgi:hypothetical protein